MKRHLSNKNIDTIFIRVADFAIDEIPILMRYLFDTYRVPSEIHTPREQNCFDRDFEGVMVKMSKRLQSGMLFRDLGYR